MKKLLYCAAALAMALFAGSCQQEKLEPVAGNGTVTFTVEAPANVQTKAIADGLNVNELVYEVWLTEEPGQEELFGDKKAERLYQSKTTMKVEDDGTNKASVTLDLVNDQNFTVLFWAQVNTPEYPAAYNTKALTKVTYAKDEYKSNDENLAAFYSVAFVKDCSHIDTDGKSISSNVILRRPFAQLNIGTINTKKPVAGLPLPIDDYTVELVSSAVEVTTANTIFNVSTGAVSGNKVVTFSDNKVPDEVLKVQKNGNEEPYEYVAMNYLFAGSNASVEYDIVTKLNGKKNVTATINNTVDNVPLKENYRTNIIGNLLTSDVDYQIVVDAGFYTPDEVVEVVTVASAAELVEAISAAPSAEGEETNLKLEGNITLGALTKSTSEEPKSITIPVGVSATIDLNGYSITGVDEETESFGLITNRGNLTVVNSSSNRSTIALKAVNDRDWNAFSSVISNTVGGNLLVKGNVLIEHLGGTDMAYGIDNLTNGKGTSAVTTVEGATVKSTYRAIRQFLNGVEATNELYVKAGSVIEGTNKSVWMQDPSKNANTGKLVVEAGAKLFGDAYLSVTEGSTEWPVEVSIADAALQGESTVLTSNIPDKYELVNSNGVWTIDTSLVVEGDVVTVYSVNALKKIAAKVNAGDTFEGKTVKLAADLDLKNEQWIPIGTKDGGCFTGTFDGNDYKIMNLKYHSIEDDWYVGLFGTTKNATIKNLTIENVDINCEKGLHFAALVGDAAGSTVIENIIIKGDVKIAGDVNNVEVGRIGAVIGGNSGKFKFKNVKVDANRGSYVKGNSSIGGLAGQLQGETTFENCSSNIDVTAQRFYAGGIIGLAEFGTTFTNCTTSGNISVLAGRAGNANDLYRVGGIAGGWDDGAEKVLSLVNCYTTCVLSGQSADGKIATTFDCAGFVGRGYLAVVGAKVIVNGTEYIYAGNGEYADADGYVMIASGLGYNKDKKTYAVSSAAGLVAMSNTTIKGRESVVLTADIDLAGVEFNGLTAFNPESNNTFDGKGYKVSNWTYEGGASDMAFIKGWVGTIKNVTIEKASLKTSGRSAVLAGKVYANIENCHIVESSIEDSYWACGVIAGLYNSGSITNCSVDGCYVKSNGGVGGIVGVINESAGERTIENCTVKNTIVNNTGAYGEGYSGALVAGMFNAGNATYKFVNCTLENNTKEGQYVGDLFYSAEGETVYVDGVQQ